MNSRPPAKPTGHTVRGQAGPSPATTNTTRPLQPGATAEDRSRRKDVERHQPKALEKGPSANGQGRNEATPPRAKDIKHVAKPAPVTIRCTTTPIDAPYAQLTTQVKASEAAPKAVKETSGQSSVTSHASKPRPQGDHSGLKPGQRDLSWVPVRSTITPIGSGYSTPALVDGPENTMQSTGLSSKSVAIVGSSKEVIALDRMINKVKDFRAELKSRPPYPRVGEMRSLAEKAKVNTATQAGTQPTASSSTMSVSQTSHKAPPPKAMRSVGVQAFASAAGDSHCAPSAPAKAPTVTSPQVKAKATTTTGTQVQPDSPVKPPRPPPPPERKQAPVADTPAAGHRAAQASPTKTRHHLERAETRKPPETIKNRKPTETAKPVSTLLTRNPQEKAAAPPPSLADTRKRSTKPLPLQAARSDAPRAGGTNAVAAPESSRPRTPKPVTTAANAATPRDSPKGVASTKKAPVATPPSEVSVRSVTAKPASPAQREHLRHNAEPSTQAREPGLPPAKVSHPKALTTAAQPKAPVAASHPKAPGTATHSRTPSAVTQAAPKESTTASKAPNQSPLVKSSLLLRPLNPTPKAPEKRSNAVDGAPLASPAPPAAVGPTATKAVPPSPKPRQPQDGCIDPTASPKTRRRAEDERMGPPPSPTPRRAERGRMDPPPPPTVPKRPSTAEASSSSTVRPLQPKPAPRPISESLCSERITSMVSYVPSVVSVKEGPEHQLRLSKADTVFSSAGSILHCTSPLQALTRDLASRTSSEASTPQASVRHSGSSAASVAFSAAGSEAAVSKTTAIESTRRAPSLQSIPRSFTIASSEDTASIRSAELFAVPEHIPLDTDSSSGYSSLTHSPAFFGNKALPHAPSRTPSILAAESLAKLDESIARLEAFAPKPEPTSKSAMKQRVDLVSCTLGDGYAVVDANDVPGSDELSAGPSRLQSGKAVRFNVAWPNRSNPPSPTSSDTDSQGSSFASGKGKGKARAPQGTVPATDTDGPPRYSSLSPLKGGFATGSTPTLPVRGRRERSQSDVTGRRLQHSRSVPFLCRTSSKLQKLKENHARGQQESSFYANQQGSRSAASLGTATARRRLAWGEDEEPVKRSAARKLWDRAKNGLRLGKKEEQLPKYAPSTVTWMTPASNVPRVRRMPEWWPPEKQSVMPP